jgi:hypothetical protein
MLNAKEITVSIINFLYEEKILGKPLVTLNQYLKHTAHSLRKSLSAIKCVKMQLKSTGMTGVT